MGTGAPTRQPATSCVGDAGQSNHLPALGGNRSGTDEVEILILAKFPHPASRPALCLDQMSRMFSHRRRFVQNHYAAGTA